MAGASGKNNTTAHITSFVIHQPVTTQNIVAITATTANPSP